MNPVAETLTGWGNNEARNQPLEAVFNIINETIRQRVENPAARALREGTVVGLSNHTILIGKQGAEYAIDDTAAVRPCQPISIHRHIPTSLRIHLASLACS